MKAFKIIFSIFISLLILCGITFFVIYTLIQPPKGEYREYKLSVPSGSSYLSVSNDLKDNGILKSSKLFYYYSRYKKASLKAGVYLVNNKMSYDELHSFLNTGKQEYISVSFPEGLTISLIGKQLEEKGVCSQKEFISTCFDADLLNEFSIPSESFEGYLFPDTYFFNPEMNPEEVVKLMVENFYTKLSTIENSKNLTINELHEVVKLASIVEKEYKVKKEAPLIASVFKNRLKYNIGLYSCATIIYIITEELGLPHPGQVKYTDLKIDSPYNTYLYAGLTPTPISNPGLVALDAAINTPKTNYYYFRVNDEAAGTHIFTTYFDEHIEAGK